MSAHAFLILDGYSEADSLNPTSWTDYYHVVGIEGWTTSNTRQKVYVTLPVKGFPHPDATRGAIVVEHRIVHKINRPAGTYPDGAGGEAVTYTLNTNEAIVAVTWSSRRAGGLVAVRDGSDRSEIERVRLPAFTRLTSGQVQLYYQRRTWISRPVLYRTRTVNATGINDNERTFLEIMTGSLVYFPYPLTPNAPYDPATHSLWLLTGTSIAKNRFNQDVLTYRFMTKSPVRAIPVTPGRIDIPIPGLQWLQEWDVGEVQGTTSDPPNPIPVLTATEQFTGAYGTPSPLNYYSFTYH